MITGLVKHIASASSEHVCDIKEKYNHFSKNSLQINMNFNDIRRNVSLSLGKYDSYTYSWRVKVLLYWNELISVYYTSRSSQSPSVLVTGYFRQKLMANGSSLHVPFRSFPDISQSDTTRYCTQNVEDKHRAFVWHRTNKWHCISCHHGWILCVTCQFGLQMVALRFLRISPKCSSCARDSSRLRAYCVHPHHPIAAGV